MFQNRINIGEYAVSDYGVNECPALIDKEVFDMVQKVKEESVHRSRENKSGYDYMLTGRMTCAKCGASVVGSSMQKGKYHYYQCHKHCGNRLRADDLHERVRSALREYLTDDKLDELASAAFAAYTEEQCPASDRELLEQELAGVEKKLQNAVAAILEGVQLDTLKITIEELKARREQLRESLDSLPTASPKLTYDHFRLALELIIEKARTEDFKALLSTVVNCIIVDDQDVVRGI